MKELLLAATLLISPPVLAGEMDEGAWFSGDDSVWLTFDPNAAGSFQSLEGKTYDMVMFYSETDRVEDVCTMIGKPAKSGLRIYNCEFSGIRHVVWNGEFVTIDGVPLAHWNPK
jgi:hypothetical protein